MSPNLRYGARRRQLPKNFAETVLDLELQIDRGNFDQETITNLI